MPPLAWMATTHLSNLVFHVTEIGSQEAGTDAKDLDAFVLELLRPVNDKHVERSL